jgi:predicted transcriptional regulator
MSPKAPVSELKRRLVYAMLQPAMALCRRFRFPLDVVDQLSRLAYYEEVRRGGATQNDVSELFGTSLRTVVAIEKQLRSDFLSPAYEVERIRRLEGALAEGERTIDELADQVNETTADVTRSMEGLVGAGRARRITGDEETRYVLSERYQSLVRDDLVSRIDGLKHQLEVLLSAVKSRFLGDDDGQAASMARTLSFVGSTEDVEAMADEVIRGLRVRAIDVEEAALQKDEYNRYAFSLTLAPMEKSTHE